MLQSYFCVDRPPRTFVSLTRLWQAWISDGSELELCQLLIEYSVEYLIEYLSIRTIPEIIAGKRVRSSAVITHAERHRTWSWVVTRCQVVYHVIRSVMLLNSPNMFHVVLLFCSYNQWLKWPGQAGGSADGCIEGAIWHILSITEHFWHG